MYCCLFSTSLRLDVQSSFQQLWTRVGIRRFGIGQERPTRIRRKQSQRAIYGKLRQLSKRTLSTSPRLELRVNFSLSLSDLVSQLWKNPVTGALHLQVHPSAVSALKIAPIPSGSSKITSAPYPNGATLTDLKEVRDLIYRLQRPAIAPSKVYAHDWKEGDMALFHNQGVLHSVVGAFEPEEVRMFHQVSFLGSSLVLLKMIHQFFLTSLHSLRSFSFLF